VGFRNTAPSASTKLDEGQVAALHAHMRQILNRYPPAEWFPWLRAFHDDAWRRESNLLLAAVESLSREFNTPWGAPPRRGDWLLAAGRGECRL
jgi:hypothetical protein